MRSRAPLVLAIGASVVLFVSIAFVFVLVIGALLFDGISFPGEPEIADAASTITSIVMRAAA